MLGMVAIHKGLRHWEGGGVSLKADIVKEAAWIILIGPIERGKRCTGRANCSSVPLYCNTLLFVNILVSGLFDGRFAQRLAVNKPPKHQH